MIKAIKLKSIIITSFAILLAVSSIVAIFAFGKGKTTFVPMGQTTIVLDAGHGGIDPGSVGRKTHITEREINLCIVNELKTLLEASKFNVVLTRKDENGLYKVYTKDYKIEDMTKRREIITDAKPALVISVHTNSFTSTARRGAQVFYDDKSPEGKRFAECVQEQFATDLEESKKTASFGDFFMLKCTTAPSILCECGYLSNEQDERLLANSEYQKKIAYAIYKGIIKYLLYT